MKKFRGGIQNGTTAYDVDSLKLNHQLSRISKALRNDKRIMEAGITYQTKLRKEQIPGGVGACSPDGGVWFNKRGKAIAAFEAKKQGDRGNAQERWFKNARILRAVNSKISYATFCTGKGAEKNGGFEQCFSIAVLNENNKPEFNRVRMNKESIFLRPEGFSDMQIKYIMRKVILGA